MAKKVHIHRKRHHEVIQYRVKVFLLVVSLFVFPVTYAALFMAR